MGAFRMRLVVLTLECLMVEEELVFVSIAKLLLLFALSPSVKLNLLLMLDLSVLISHGVFGVVAIVVALVLKSGVGELTSIVA